MTPAEAIKIRNKCKGMCASLLGDHPLEGKSVAAWVAEARRGWPRPIRYNPSPTLLRRLSEASDVEEMTV